MRTVGPTKAVAPRLLGDTGWTMREESTIPDLVVERVGRLFEAANRWDFDTAMSFYASDCLWEARLNRKRALISGWTAGSCAVD
jgi:hypothetical protein